jgi:hypothetical protein
MTRVVRALVAFILVAAVAGHATAQSPVTVPEQMSALAGQHPAEYYRRAAALFSEGKKDDAVFVFYLGQLRYRAHLAARRSELKPDGDPALFSSLSEVVGRPLNEYAFGDIPRLAGTIDALLAYDVANPDRFTPPAQFREAYGGIRDGLSGMKREILKDADSIRAKRRQNGLENRN